MVQEFDHIIVGGGSAGCACAGRLAEVAEGSILVLEAGPPDDDPRVKIPFALIRLLGDGQRDWRRKTVPQATAAGREIGVPRGRMLGGSGSLNSMVWFRGRASDFDGWSVPGWGWHDVRPAYEALEERVAPVRLPDPHLLSRNFGESLRGNDPTAPPTPERESAGVVHVNMRDGRRFSAADAFLRPAEASGRVTVRANVEVDRVEIDGGKATAVITRGGGRIVARKGVILSAGAIETPMILFRSGLGPGEMLRAASLPVVLDIPGIGANLHDHPGMGLHFTGTGYGLTLAQLPAWALSPAIYAFSRKGRLSSNTVEAGAFLKVRHDARFPEVQSHFLPFMLGWKGRPIVWGAGFFADAVVCNPRSRGRLSIGADKRIPLIDYALLSDPWDLETLALGLERLRAILQTLRLGPGVREAHPGAGVTGEALKGAIRAGCGTAYHPVGTVAMGGPLDARLRLKGVEGLHVADASVMPAVTSANTNAPSMMIGWRAAEIIAEDAAGRLAA